MSRPHPGRHPHPDAADKLEKLLHFLTRDERARQREIFSSDFSREVQVVLDESSMNQMRRCIERSRCRHPHPDAADKLEKLLAFLTKDERSLSLTLSHTLLLSLSFLSHTHSLSLTGTRIRMQPTSSKNCSTS